LINFEIDVAKLAHRIAAPQRQFGDSLQLTQIQRDSTNYLIQPTHFAIFATVCEESLGKVCGGIWWGGEKCVTL